MHSAEADGNTAKYSVECLRSPVEMGSCTRVFCQPLLPDMAVGRLVNTEQDDLGNVADADGKRRP